MSNVDQHTVTDAPDHEIAKRRLAETLTNFGVGRDNAISGKDLAAKTPVSASTTRDLIAEVRTDFHLPVASCSDGYFVVSDADELAEVCDRIDRTIQTKRQRKRELVASFNQ